MENSTCYFSPSIFYAQFFLSIKSKIQRYLKKEKKKRYFSEYLPVIPITTAI